MQTHFPGKPSNNNLAPARISSSYTCPRCRQYGKSTACTRCGWTPQTAAEIWPQAGHEDRIIAC
jgi:hypothetical protein